MVKNMTMEETERLKMNMIRKDSSGVTGKDIPSQFIADGVLYFWMNNTTVVGTPLENIDRFELYIEEENQNGK